MRNRRIEIKILLLLFIVNLTSCLSVEKYKNLNQHLGVFSSVTESDCNLEIILNSSGKGIARQTCRLEDGTHKDAVKEIDFSWTLKNDSIFICYASAEVELIYDPSLSCELFGSKGVASGLVLKTTEDNIFSGYGNRFWKNIQECK